LKEISQFQQEANVDPWTGGKDIDLASYEGRYPKSLFNKGVRLENENHVGHCDERD
jgi:hypothetical protein